MCYFCRENKSIFKRKKVRTKKLLSLFQDNKEKFLKSQENGVWMPIPQINAGKYIIKVVGFDALFSDDFEEKFEYEGFNIDNRWCLDW